MKELEKGALGGEQERGERRADAILPRLLGQHVYRLKPLMSVGMPITFDDVMHLRTLPGGIMSLGTSPAPLGLAGPPLSGRLPGLGLAPPGFLPIDGARVLSIFF